MQGITFKANAQSPVTKNLITHFGAVGDGVTDDSHAFLKAWLFFTNQRDENGNLLVGNAKNVDYPTQSGELIIPYLAGNNIATYLVGVQLLPGETICLNYNGTIVCPPIANATPSTPKEWSDWSLQNPLNNANANLTSFFGKPVPLLNMNACLWGTIDGFTIRGDNNAYKSKIKYKNDFLYGTFLYGNLPAIIPDPSLEPNYSNFNKAQVGDFMVTRFAKNIKIENIEIDGNSSEYIVGGYSGDLGRQLSPSGFRFDCTDGIVVNKVTVSKMGFDGLEISGISNNISLNNSNFISNGRQGFSWTGGTNLVASYCKFSQTGKEYNSSLGYALSSSPAAGIDIESEGYYACNNNYSLSTCENGKFNHCEIINNTGLALVNDGCADVNNPSCTNRSENMLFFDCTFHDVEDYAIWAKGNKYVFDDCDIYGTVVHVNEGTNPTFATQFLYCEFEDKPYQGIHLPSIYKMVEYNDCKNTLFDNCTFKVNDKDREFFYLNWNTNNLLESDYTVIDHCTFTYNNEGHPGENPSFIRGVKFKGSNKIENIKNGLNSYHLFNTREILIEGSGNPCSPNLFTLEGQVEHLHFGNNNAVNPEEIKMGYQQNNIDGYLQYFANGKSLVGVNLGNRLNISSTSAMHFNTNASLYGAGQYECNGGLLMHKGSYLNLAQGGQFNNPTNVNSNNLIYIDQKCNQQLSISPIWCNGIGFGTGVSIQPILNGVWQGAFSNGTCVQGAHADIASPLCTTLYSQVVNSGSMNLLYKTDISCFGGANAMISFTVNGGTPNYTITCVDINAGAPLSFNANYTVSTGIHTFVVQDANCMQAFVVPVETTLEYNIVKGCVSNTPATITTNACSATIAPNTASLNVNGGWDISAAGIYTITATTAQNATVTKTFYIGDCSACAAAPDEAEWYAPSTPTTAISPDGILAQKAIVLQGNVQVDNEWFIYNHNVNANNVNTNVFLTAGASLDIDPDMAIVINRSKLQGCFDYWNGIFTSGAGERVIVNNQSTVQDMQTGIFIMNNAFLQARNSYFTNNQTSLHFYNSLNPDPESFIYSNHFSGNASMFSNANGNRPGCGIKLWQVGDFEIGSNTDAALGNSFENMSNGIYIKQTQSGGVSSRIGIYNNKFTNITHHLTDYDKMSSCFTGPLGAAIYSDADASSLIQSHLDVQSDASVSTPGFQNCDKAVVTLGSGLTAKNLKTDNCLLGIMCYSIYNRPFEIVSNQILNAHMGIKLSGLMLNATISGNEMLLSKTIFSPASIILAPIGIRYQISSDPLAIQPHNISGNNIIINRIAGIGILNGNADSRLTENGNTTSFSTNNTASANGYNIRSLTGYWNENNWRSLYVQNTTNGITNAAVWPLRNSMGMYMNQSPNCVLDCNRLKFTRYGFYVWGKNNTNEKSVTYNKCNANEIPWFFLDNNSAGSGTFGDVGGINDNGNEFISTTNPVDWRGVAGINTGAYKVLRNGSGLFLARIYTDFLLDQLESGPQLSGYEYKVDPPAINGYTDPCVDNENYEPDYRAEAMMDSSELNYNMAIINDTVTYINYPEVGRWIDKYRLYSELDADSMLLNSKPEYLYFYNDTTNQTIGAIRAAARLIALLYDTSTNGGNDSSRYADAVAANVLISSANNWEMNEKVVNDVLLYLYYNAVDSIPAQMQQDIQALASSCPFVNGTAVYRARSLWTLWEPDAIFDDRLLCIQGQNKNQDNSQINIDSLIENEIIAASVKATENNTVLNNININKLIVGSATEIKIFPNPAQNIIIVEYQCDSDGEIVLFNALGQEVLKTKLIKGRGKVQIQINDIAKGVYQYKCTFDKCTEKIGKLIIQK